MRTLTALLLLTLLSIGTASAQDYCVSTDPAANNSNAGTYSGDPADCWATWAHAEDEVSDTDEVCFFAGNYAGASISTTAADVTWSRCPGVAYRQVTIGPAGASSDRVVSIGNIDGHTFDGILVADPDVRGDFGTRIAKHFVSMDGNNAVDVTILDLEAVFSELDVWELRAMYYGSASVDAPEIHDNSQRYRILRVNGNRTRVAGMKAAYWMHQMIGEGDGTTNLIFEDFDLSYAYHTTIAANSDCTLSKPLWLKNNHYRKGVARAASTLSDFWQVNPDYTNSDNPVAYTRSNGVQEFWPCGGGFSFTDLYLMGFGENVIDGKGLAGIYVDRVVLVGTMGEDDWIYDDRPSATCGWTTITRGSDGYYVDWLLRNVTSVDNGNGFNADDAFGIYYNNVFLNNRRAVLESMEYPYGATSVDCVEHSTLTSVRGQTGPGYNSVHATTGPAYQDRSSPAPQSDGNVFTPDVIFHENDTSGGGFVTQFESLSAWQSGMGVDANSYELSYNDVFVDNTVSATTAYNPFFYEIDFDQVMADFGAGKYELESDIGGDTDTAGVDFIKLTSAASAGATEIEVGTGAHGICCWWGDLRDKLRIEGVDYDVVDVTLPHTFGVTTDPGTVEITPGLASSASVGEAVHVVYASGKTSKMVGAELPNLDTPPPVQPPESPHSYPVIEPDQDGEEGDDGTVVIGASSLNIGAVAGGGSQTSIDVSVASGADDCMDPNWGAADCDYDRGSLYNFDNWIAWRDLGIPAGSTIDSATLTVGGYSGATTGDRDVAIELQSGCTATAPADGVEGSIAGLSTLTGSVTWSSLTVPWLYVDYTSPDFASLMQDAVDQGCWDEDADLGIVIRDEGSANYYFSMYEHAQTHPSLQVTYTPPSAGGPVETALIMPVDAAGGTALTNGSLFLTAAGSDSAAAAWTISAYTPPQADLVAAANNISDRTTIGSVSCASIPAWSAGNEYELTDTECPGLTGLLEDVVDHGSYDLRIALGITGTGLRRAKSVEAGAVSAPALEFDATTNQPPSLTPIGAQSVGETELLTFTASASDAEDGTATLSADFSGLPAGDAAFVPGTGVFSWTPALGDALGSPYSMTVTATDSDGATDQEVVEITVANEPPVLAPIGPQSVTEGESMTFTAAAYDAEDGTATLSADLSGLPDGVGTFNPSTGVFEWTPTPDKYQGSPYSITITATDSGGKTASEVVPIDVDPPGTNQPPQLDPIGPQMGDVGTPISFTATGSDPEDGTPTLSADLTGLPVGNASFTPGTGLFTWTPASGDAAGSPYSITVTATDTDSATDSELVEITVTEAGDPGVVDLELDGEFCGVEQDRNTGTVDTNSSDFEFAYDYDRGRHQVVALCFDEVPLADTDVVTRAYLQFEVDEASVDFLQIYISTEMVPDAGRFTGAAFNVSTRWNANESPRVIEWEPPNWLNLQERGEDQRTPELRRLVQETISQVGWVRNNRIAFFLYSDGVTTATRVAETNPTLHLEYSPMLTTSATTGGDGDTVGEDDLGGLDTEAGIGFEEDDE